MARNDGVRGEVMGPTYKIIPSEGDRHAGDPQPHGYEHPQPLGRAVLDPGGPRILPVSQTVQHGPAQDRQEAFEAALREGAAYAAAVFGWMGFKDRRHFGPRYRPTDNVDELVERHQQPYGKGWQRDVPIERYRGF